MNLKSLTENLGDFARDVRLNVSNVLSVDGAPGLTLNQIASVALASSYGTKNMDLVRAVKGEFAETLTPADIEGAKAAATIMGMNNIYYRFLHLSKDKEFSQMPAKLRMNIIANPGVPKVDFELSSLAVSAISGCGMCINAHVKQVKKEGITAEGVQSAVRIASVINSAAAALAITE
jgi:alkyl hydroperoxide reductase subunit D